MADTKPLNATPGGRLKRLIVERATSQKQLAEDIKVHPVTLSRWVNNEQKISGKNLVGLAKALLTTPEYIRDGSSEKSFCSEAMVKFGLSEGELAELLETEPEMIHTWVSKPGAITPVAHSNLSNLLLSGVDAHRGMLTFRKATQWKGEGAPVGKAQTMIDLIEESAARGYPKWFLVYMFESILGPTGIDADKSIWYGYKMGIGYEPPTDEILADVYEQIAKRAIPKNPKAPSDEDVAKIAGEEADDLERGGEETEDDASSS